MVNVVGCSDGICDVCDLNSIESSTMAQVGALMTLAEAKYRELAAVRLLLCSSCTLFVHP